MLITALAIFCLSPSSLPSQNVLENAELEISRVIPQDATFNVQWLDAANESHAIVKTSAGSTLVFRVGREGGTVLLEKEGKIEAVLRQAAIKNGDTPLDARLVEQLSLQVLKLNGTRQEEMVCRRYMGNEKSLCSTRDECQKACYGVTSLCRPVAEGAGFDFIDAIVQYNENVQKFDLEVLDDGRLLSDFKARQDGKALEAYLAHVSRIFAHVSNLSSSSLKKSYYFCPTPAYDMTGITIKREELVKAIAKAQGLMSAKDAAAQSAQAATKILSAKGGKKEGQKSAASGNGSRRGLEVLKSWGQRAFFGFALEMEMTRRQAK